MKLWWLSFADGGLPKGQQFLGVVIVAASSFVEAVRVAWTLGINPGGECVGEPVHEGTDIPIEYREKLLSREEISGLGVETEAQ